MKKYILLLIIPFLTFGQEEGFSERDTVINNWDDIVFAKPSILLTKIKSTSSINLHKAFNSKFDSVGIELNQWSDFINSTKIFYETEGYAEDGEVILNPWETSSINPLFASSTLNSQGKNSYFLSNLNDYDYRTAWVEGEKGYGIGEYFEIEAVNINVIYNGYSKSSASWENNSRVKKFKVFQNDKFLCYLKLQDVMGAQYFKLPVIKSNVKSKWKFEISEIYSGEKWDDVAITHIDYTNFRKSQSFLQGLFEDVWRWNSDEIEKFWHDFFVHGCYQCDWEK